MGLIWNDSQHQELIPATNSLYKTANHNRPDHAEITLGIYEQRHDHGFVYTHELGKIHNRRRELESAMSYSIGNSL